MAREKNEIPSPADFFTKLALYEIIEWDKNNEAVFIVADALYCSQPLDCYCVGCVNDSVFTPSTSARPSQLDYGMYKRKARKGMTGNVPELDERLYVVGFKCIRNKSHLMYFIFFVSSEINEDFTSVYRVQKIGQSPSHGELNIPKVKQYKSVLTEEKGKEFVRAIGLASHDVGIGSYAYLRRIFEHLVEEAHLTALDDDGWNEEEYNRSRMSEKIQLLKHHLPEFLVDHPEMYSILSKGLHELSDEDCLEHFDALKVSIELILDEKLAAKNRETILADASKAINKASNTIHNQTQKEQKR